MNAASKKTALGRQQGAALLFALGVTAILAVLAFRLLAERTASQGLGAAVMRQLDNEAAAFSAGSLFRASLAAGGTNAPTTFHDDWARLDGKRLPLTSSGRIFRIAATNLSGLFPVNALLDAEGRESPAHVQVFRRLLFEADKDMNDVRAQALTQSLLDWIDADGAQRPQGAESGYYLALASPFPCADRPLQNIAELERIKGFTKTLLYGKDGSAGLTAYLRTETGDGRININTAPQLVLQALTGDGHFSFSMAEFRARPEISGQLADLLWYQKLPGYDPSWRIPPQLAAVTGNVFSLCLGEEEGEKGRISCAVYLRATDGAVTLRENILY